MSEDERPRGCPVLEVGDVMRMSVEMIQEIHAQAGHVSPKVKVSDIVVEPDGSKIVYLRRVDGE